MPWLVSAACGIALWILAATGPARPALPRGLLAAAAGVVAWAALPHLPLRPEVVMLAAGLLLAVLAAGFARDPEIAQGLQAGFLSAASVSAVLGLVQYFGLSPWFAPWANIAQAGEAYANLRQPNQYATLCWVGGAVVLFGTVPLRRPVAAGLLALLAAGSAASVSRTGMLQGLVLTVLAALWAGPARRERLQLCALAVLAYFGATVLLPVLLDLTTGAMPARTLWGRMGGGEPCSSRIVLWSNVLHLVAMKPWTGWGWGELDFAHFDTLYAGPRFCDILDNAHDLPLHLAVELGVPLAALACVGALAWAWRQRPWREAEPRRQLAWAVAALILLHSLLEYPLWYGPFQIAFGASLGWLLAAPASAGARSRLPALAGGALMAAALGYAAWDYARVTQIYIALEERLVPWADDTLGQVRRSWLFSGQARFAEITLEAPDQSNAQRLYALALDVLHYSPEPRVIERAIESATLLGRDREAQALQARYRAAFPRDYEAWRSRQRNEPR
ncbi:MAG: O-antigen ligase C-terminal domain-containing protein [Burkholderiales bacterium]|nr:O-antigen ligase C-terminal domain-containing protein [Burkholderiales bacterium]